MKKTLSDHINAILATIAIHLVVLIFFYITRMSHYYRESNRFTIDFVSQTEEDRQKEAEEKSKQDLVNKMADAMIAGEQRHNLAVNESPNQRNAQVTDNFLKAIQSEADQAKNHLEDIKTETNKPEETPKDEDNIQSKKPPVETKTVIYKGKSTSQYNVGKRNAVYTPLPTYKCQGSGNVIVSVEVNQKGEVVSANIDKTASSADECFYDEARNAAYRWRFNADFSAPGREKGTISFYFIAQ